MWVGVRPAVLTPGWLTALRAAAAVAGVRGVTAPGVVAPGLRIIDPPVAPVAAVGERAAAPVAVALGLRVPVGLVARTGDVAVPVVPLVGVEGARVVGVPVAGVSVRVALGAVGVVAVPVDWSVLGRTVVPPVVRLLP